MLLLTLLLAAALPSRAATLTPWAPPFAPASPALVSSLQAFGGTPAGAALVAQIQPLARLQELSPQTELHRRCVGAMSPYLPEGFEARLQAAVRSPEPDPAELNALADMLAAAHRRALAGVAAALSERAAEVSAAVAAGSIGVDELSAAAAELRDFGFYGPEALEKARPLDAMAKVARAEKTLATAQKIAAKLGFPTAPVETAVAPGLKQEAHRDTLALAEVLIERLHEETSISGGERVVDRLVALARANTDEALHRVIAHGLVAELKGESDSGYGVTLVKALAALGESSVDTVREIIVTGIMEDVEGSTDDDYVREAADAAARIADSAGRQVRDLTKGLLLEQLKNSSDADHAGSLHDALARLSGAAEAVPPGLSGSPYRDAPAAPDAGLARRAVVLMAEHEQDLGAVYERLEKVSNQDQVDALELLLENDYDVSGMLPALLRIRNPFQVEALRDLAEAEADLDPVLERLDRIAGQLQVDAVGILVAHEYDLPGELDTILSFSNEHQVEGLRLVAEHELDIDAFIEPLSRITNEHQVAILRTLLEDQSDIEDGEIIDHMDAVLGADNASQPAALSAAAGSLVPVRWVLAGLGGIKDGSGVALVRSAAAGLQRPKERMSSALRNILGYWLGFSLLDAVVYLIQGKGALVVLLLLAQALIAFGALRLLSRSTDDKTRLANRAWLDAHPEVEAAFGPLDAPGLLPPGPAAPPQLPPAR